MKRVFRLLSLVLAVFLVVGMIAGCGSKKTESSQPSQTQQSSQESKQEAKPVKIVLWEQMEPKATEVFDKYAKEFMNKYPNLTIERIHYTTEDLRSNYQNAVLAGSGPDLIYGPNDNIGVFEAGKLIQPVDDVLPKSFLDTLDKMALDASSMKGKIWAVPDIMGNHLGLVVNNDLEKNPPKTWNDIIEFAKTFNDGKKYALVFNQNEPYWFIPFLGAYDGKVFDDKYNPTLDTPAMVNALKFYQDIKFKYNLIPKESDYDTASNMFKEGKAAMIINGAWSWMEYKDAGMNITIVPIPQIDGAGAPKPYVGTKGYSISPAVKDEAKKEALTKFFEFFLSKEVNLDYAKASSQLPTNKEALSDDSVKNDFLFKASAELLKGGTPMPIVAEMRAVWDAIRPSQEALMSNKTTPEKAAKEIQAKAVEGIKTMLGK